MAGKTIIIGATSGMGLALAKLLVADGGSVGVTGRRCELLEAFRQEHPSRVFTACFDVAETNDVHRHLDDLVSRLGGLDLLVISAGYGEENPQLHYGIEKGMIETNVRGFTAVADWAFHYFRQHAPGHIAALTSIAGIRGNRAAPGYFATKAYQISYLQALRQKAAREKMAITITDIRPGFVRTDAASGKLFWVSSVDKAAGQIYRAIRRKKPVAYISRRWRIVAALLRLLPAWLYNRI